MRDPLTGRFLPGCAPGPGRPKGRTRLAGLLSGTVLAEIDVDLLKRAVASVATAAAGGDLFAAKLLMSKIPDAEASDGGLELPRRLETADDFARAQTSILRAVASGQTTPSEGLALQKLLAGAAESGVWAALEQRVRELEAERSA